MTIKKILAAAATAAVLSVAGATGASADNSYGRDNNSYDNSYDNGYDHNHYDRDYGNRGGYEHRSWRDGYDHRSWRHEHRRFADRDTIFRSLRYHHIRYVGDPYWVRGHYVVRSYNGYGRVSFIEIDPYSGDVIGVIRL